MHLSSLAVAVFACCGFSLWKYWTPYNNLHDIKAVFNPTARTTTVSFYYLNSFASLVDYKMTQEGSERRGHRYCLTLISQYVGRRPHKINPQIRPAGDAKTQVTILMGQFEPDKDTIFYRDRKGTYPIPVDVQIQ